MRRLLLLLLIVFGGGALLLLLLALLFASTSRFWQWNWVADLPYHDSVRLEPARPFIKLADFPPGSAFGLILRAAAAEAQVTDAPTLPFEMKALSSRPWTDGSFPVAEKLIEESQPAIEWMRQAAAAPSPRMPGYRSPMDDLSYLTKLQRINTAERASALREESRRNLAGAFSLLNESLDEADLLSRGGTLIHRLVEVGEEVASAKEMRLISLRNEIPAPVAAQAVQHLVALDQKTEPWAEAYRQEIPAVVPCVDFFLDPAIPSLFSMSPDSSISSSEKSLRTIASHGGWLVGSSRQQSIADITSVYSNLIEAAENPYDPRPLRKLDALFSRPLPPLGWITIHDPVGYFLSRTCVTAIMQYSIRCDEVICALRGTEIVLALRQYEQATGRPPATLSELVPKYLPAIPLDPFDGKPFRYKSDGKKWSTYSVGPNQIDEGGLVRDFFPKTWDAPGDVVFSSEEAATAK